MTFTTEIKGNEETKTISTFNWDDDDFSHIGIYPVGRELFHLPARRRFYSFSQKPKLPLILARDSSKDYVSKAPGL